MEGVNQEVLILYAREITIQQEVILKGLTLVEGIPIYIHKERMLSEFPDPAPAKAKLRIREET